MAVLTNEQRAAVTKQLMERLSEDREVCGISKQDLRAAVNGTDDWLDANAAAANQALPQPARSALTAAQKSMMLTAVANERWGGG